MHFEDTIMPIRFRLTPFIFALAAIAASPAGAEEHASARTPMLPRYQQECAACHTAYPPGMLPQASWQRIMNNLPHHFGADASLDAATVKELSTWLDQNAATYRRFSEAPPEDRITRSNWFIHKHRELPASVWTRPAVRSASNCMACHTAANQGDFNEDFVRIPR